MPYYYTDPRDEDHPNALPDVEVFGPVTWGECPACDALVLTETWQDGGCPHCGRDAADFQGENLLNQTQGHGYAFGFPGCLWDSEPVGPFTTEEEALAKAREVNGFDANGPL